MGNKIFEVQTNAAEDKQKRLFHWREGENISVKCLHNSLIVSIGICL